jgi:Surface-adhesin protein E
MRKIILTLVLSVVCGNTMAEWTDVGGNDYSTVFADPASIRKVDNYEEMFSLYDTDIAETIGDISFMSSKSLDEYDCKRKQSRTLAFYWYSGNMGEGKILYGNTDVGKWSLDLPKSINETLWKIACGKK